MVRSIAMRCANARPELSPCSPHAAAAHETSGVTEQVMDGERRIRRRNAEPWQVVADRGMQVDAPLVNQL